MDKFLVFLLVHNTTTYIFVSGCRTSDCSVAVTVFKTSGIKLGSSPDSAVFLPSAPADSDAAEQQGGSSRPIDVESDSSKSKGTHTFVQILHMMPVCH